MPTLKKLYIFFPQLKNGVMKAGSSWLLLLVLCNITQSAMSQFKIISSLPSQEYNGTKFEESNNSPYLFVCSSVTT